MAPQTAAQPLAALGKIAHGTFQRIIEQHLGAVRPEVLVGPRHGVDVGIVDLGGGQVMALSTDPFFIVPDYGWERAAWFAVHIAASDVATCGFRPAYCTVDLNLPLSMTDDELAEMWLAVHEASSEIGMAIVAGHTGRYQGCTYPMLGAATVMSIGPRDAFVTPDMAEAGDAIIMTKGAAIETAGILGITFPNRIVAALGPEQARTAADLFWQMSVVTDALVAAAAGVREEGVTAMHDATERGVWGGLCEIAAASRVGMLVDQDAILIRPEVRAVCDLFAIDPYTTSSEGTLLLTCRPHRVQAVVDLLATAGIDARQIGEITPATRGVRVTHDGRERDLDPPALDPFWPAYSKALEEGGS